MLMFCCMLCWCFVERSKLGKQHFYNGAPTRTFMVMEPHGSWGFHFHCHIHVCPKAHMWLVLWNKNKPVNPSNLSTLCWRIWVLREWIKLHWSPLNHPEPGLTLICANGAGLIWNQWRHSLYQRILEGVCPHNHGTVWRHTVGNRNAGISLVAHQELG